MNGILSGMPPGILGQQNDPFSDPRTMAMLQASLSLMGSSGPSLTPVSLGQSLGQAGKAGIQGYAQAQQAQKANILTNLQMLQLKKELEKTDALKKLWSETAPTPLPQQALAQGAATGDIGPTVGNAARLDAMQQNPAASQYTPLPVDRLRAAAAQGVDISPFLKLDEAARPDVMRVPLGNKERLIDKRTMRVLGEYDVGAAPASVPFEAQGSTPGDYRGFLLNKASAGAAKNVQNVNAYLPASEAAQRDFMDKTSKTYDALKNAPVALQNIAAAREIAKSGNPFLGSFGTQKAAVAQFFNNNFGTNIAPDAVADAGELKNRLFQQIMDNLKKMDAAPSQLQQQLMMEALGSINTDPKALEKIMGVTEEVIRGKVDIHNREVQSAETRGVKFPFNPVIALPSLGAPDKPKKEAATFDALPNAAQYRGRTIRDTQTGKLMRSDGMGWKEVKQ